MVRATDRIELGGGWAPSGFQPELSFERLRVNHRMLYMYGAITGASGARLCSGTM